ncbi:hypothetical protein CJF32_00005908 [Rutstroemia sp. NJR-2017a WRK4]|nr:hypothetical protein CJF32_00005908 [Rutstroemia sp. NJR-2017a WRK4]
MRIACLQFAPQVGDVDNNLNRADAVLSRANPKNIDLLVLPELAFSEHITPYLEPTTSGITSLWARTTALKHNCIVTVGYPEKVDSSPRGSSKLEYYNSAVTVNQEGETIANYRKSFLYYTDETWAHEGPDGFFDGQIDGLGNVAMGICKWPTKSFERMDLNPYKFEAPWSAWEFAYHILHKQANFVILSMAWLTREDPRSYSRLPKEPDMDTLSYWLARLEPVIRAESVGEIIVVLANRCGNEGEALYAGTSAVLGIDNGEVRVYGILGRGEKELLVVDTSKRPKAKLVSEPNSTTSEKSTNNELGGPSVRTRSRTNSTVSSRPSVATSSTAATTPSSAISMNDVIMNDILTPISAATSVSLDFRSPRERKAGVDTLRDNIQSVFGQEKPKSSLPNTTTVNHTQSPKSPNVAFSPTQKNFSRPLSPMTETFGRSREPVQNERSRGLISAMSPTSSQTPDRQTHSPISRTGSPPTKKHKQLSNKEEAQSVQRSNPPKEGSARVNRETSPTYIGPVLNKSPKSSKVSSPQNLPRIDTRSASPSSPQILPLVEVEPVLVDSTHGTDLSESQESTAVASGQNLSREKGVKAANEEELSKKPPGQSPSSSISAPDEHQSRSPFFSTGTVLEPRSAYIAFRPKSTMW